MAPESCPCFLQSAQDPPSSAVPATPTPASLRNPLRVSVLCRAASSNPAPRYHTGAPEPAIRGNRSPPTHARQKQPCRGRSRIDPFSTTFPLEPGFPSSGSLVTSISGYATELPGADMLTVALPSGCTV